MCYILLTARVAYVLLKPYSCNHVAEQYWAGPFRALVCSTTLFRFHSFLVSSFFSFFTGFFVFYLFFTDFLHFILGFNGFLFFILFFSDFVLFLSMFYWVFFGLSFFSLLIFHFLCFRLFHHTFFLSQFSLISILSH